MNMLNAHVHVRVLIFAYIFGQLLFVGVLSAAPDTPSAVLNHGLVGPLSVRLS